MAIADTYNELILEQIIKEILAAGVDPTIDEIESRLATFLATHDTNKPLFKASEHSTVFREISRAAKQNNTDEVIRRDLIVLYREMFELARRGVEQFDRWRAEAGKLESRLKRLEGDVSSELLLAADTEGYLGFVGDSFENTSLIDLGASSVLIDLVTQTVSIAPTVPEATATTRLNLNHLLVQDIDFIVLTRQGLQASVLAPSGDPIHALTDQTSFWQHRVYMSSSTEPVTAELKIKLGEVPVGISRISIQLNSSSTGTGTQITPMLSEDGINYSQLPVDDFTKSVVDNVSWGFPKKSAKFVKFIMNKLGHDTIDGSLYVYEFGAKYINFYTEGFIANAISRLISTPLGVRDATSGRSDVALAFRRVACEVCESLPPKTRIDYYITVSNSPLVPYSDGTWHHIDPKTRSTPIYPTVLEVGDLVELPALEARISYDTLAATPAANRNPAAMFSLLDAGGVVGAATASASGRYTFQNSGDRILDLQVHPDLRSDNNRLVILRNLGSRGVTTTVRGTQRGWGFAEPYYLSIVQINNPNGLDIDLGPRPVILDEESRSGITNIPQGLHKIKVHKESWVNVAAGATDLAALIMADPLFPYNHKLLIEGYTTPATVAGNPYRGADRFAEMAMESVSPYDMSHNVARDNFSKYAIDLDTGDAGADRVATRVFVVKVDESQADFMNEVFLLSFRLVNQSFTFLRFRADLSTEDAGVAPNLDSYRLRLGS